MPGFKLTTFWLWVCYFNHYTRAAALAIKFVYDINSWCRRTNSFWVDWAPACYLQQKVWCKYFHWSMKRFTQKSSETESFSQIIFFCSTCRYLKTLWPDTGIKSSPIFSKVAQKVTTAVYTSKVMLSKYPKSHQTFGLFLKDNLSPRIFKNRPIWSHC